MTNLPTFQELLARQKEDPAGAQGLLDQGIRRQPKCQAIAKPAVKTAPKLAAAAVTNQVPQFLHLNARVSPSPSRYSADVPLDQPGLPDERQAADVAAKSTIAAMKSLSPKPRS